MKITLGFLFFALFFLLTTNSTTIAMRSIKQILPQTPRHWVGDGFHVHPTLGRAAFSESISPALMLDYAPPKQFPSTTKRLGVGQHPHRGFETVTIAFQGEVEHADSLGNTGVIGSGDIQWMTAARGIIHEEFHSTAFAASGGVFEMIQLWVDLPKEKKMMKPEYQPILMKDIPQVPLNDGSESCSAGNGYVRVIAGEFKGTKGPAHTQSPMSILDILLSPSDGPLEVPIQPGWTGLLLVRAGSVTVHTGDTTSTVGPQSTAILSREGATLRMQADQKDSKIFLFSGQPLEQPVAARGPFVMNTQAELQQAMMDFQSGNFGQ
jgi:quercetin 2,3-dioxygenase